MRGIHRSLHAAWPLIVLLWYCGLTGQPLQAQSEPPPPPALPAETNDSVVPITSHRTQIELIEKFSKVFETKNRIARVSGFDPVILNVNALPPSTNRISVSGLMQGVTSLIITDETGANFTVEVFVKGDARTLQTIIDRKFPNCSIEAFKVQDAVALRGWVTNPEHITQITEIAEQFYPKVLNQMKVGGVQQVLLKVKVMEAQRSLIRELGMNFTYLTRNGYVNSAPGALNTLTNVTYTPLSFTSTSRDLTGSFGIVGNNSVFNAYITALHDESLLKILAEPEVVATNGRPATLLSGGEFPIVVPQSLGTVSIQWREFGVRMEAVPIVLGGGALRLELQPEVSERDFTNAVTIGGTTVPGLTVRRVNTQVEMKFGQTLMLAGLISNRQSATTHKIPVLGELPYIGAAFSRKRFEDSETEVVITVTPELVAPLEDGQVPVGGPGQFTDSPVDRELMGYGLIEVPKYGERCATCEPGRSGPLVVPGLKEPLNPVVAPGSGSTSAPADRKELLAPPAPTDAETTERARRFAAAMAAKQKSRKSTSGVRQVGFDAASAKKPATESTRSTTPATRSATSAPARPTTKNKTDSPTAAARPSGGSDVSSRGTTSANSSDSTTPRSRKPGLIEPSAWSSHELRN